MLGPMRLTFRFPIQFSETEATLSCCGDGDNIQIQSFVKIFFEKLFIFFRTES